MMGKIVRSCGELSDAKSRYEPLKKGSKDDPIIVSNSKEVDQNVVLEDNALPFEEGEPIPAWFTSEEDYKKKREEILKYDEPMRRKIIKELEEKDFDYFRCSSFDTKIQSTKKRLIGDPEDMDFEMSYARVNEKDYQDFDVDEDEDHETPPHYHSDEFHDDSSSEE
ncbi:hypothetical protein FNV43_RR24679 [Rhamnella rubrinervis]|uniref:Uncharacterized protein n=1 Tax=Rhamnella rubrinervis TaxID=2594499 RepID=A0A8K0DLZ3_9ROSA|nr:hypothetical protein FNV43_RR24679 [Rhamnella rubrinervis]